jgi:hypothetical protein
VSSRVIFGAAPRLRRRLCAFLVGRQDPELAEADSTDRHTGSAAQHNIQRHLISIPSSNEPADRLRRTAKFANNKHPQPEETPRPLLDLLLSSRIRTVPDSTTAVMKAMKSMNVNRMLGSLKRRRKQANTHSYGHETSQANNRTDCVPSKSGRRTRRLESRYSRSKCSTECGTYSPRERALSVNETPKTDMRPAIVLRIRGTEWNGTFSAQRSLA